MTGESLSRPLTQAERNLVESYHNLIYRVMHDTKFFIPDPGYDAYGECALALILAAQRYMTDEKLQKLSFSTVAYRTIARALHNGVMAASRRPQIVSLDSCKMNGMYLYDMLIPEEVA